MMLNDEKNFKLILQTLKRLHCTANLSSAAQQLLATVAIRKHFHSARGYCWEAGDSGEFFVIIVNGLVEITRFNSQSDQETLMGLFGPSDVIGLSAVMRKSIYPGTAKVICSDTEILKFYIRPILQQKSDAVSEIQNWIREMFLLHEQVLRDKIDILNAGKADLKIFELMNHLIRRFGEHHSNTEHFIPIHITRAQIARLVNIRVETAIRVISAWQKLKLIQLKPQGITIHNLPLLKKHILKGTQFK